MCCLQCCDGLCNGINRIFNLLLSIAGLSFAGFGVFLAFKQNWNFDYFTITTISVGALLGLSTGVYTCFGHKSYCYNSFYIWLMVLLILCDGTAAGLLFAKTDEILKSLKEELGPDNSQFLDKSHIVVTGYVTLGLTGLQILAIILAWCHRQILVDLERQAIDLGGGGMDALLQSDRERDLERSTGIKVSELASTSVRSNEYEAALEESEKSEGARAASKYRSKYSDLYAKYNIDKN
jgi:hypothetical protein